MSNPKLTARQLMDETIIIAEVSIHTVRRILRKTHRNERIAANKFTVKQNNIDSNEINRQNNIYYGIMEKNAKVI